MDKEELTKRAEALQKELDALKVEINKPENNNQERDEWFTKICLDIKPVLENGNINWLNSKGELIFYDTKNSYIYYSYYKIWTVLRDKYNMKGGDIKQYVTDMLLTVLNWGGKTPQIQTLCYLPSLLTVLNWGGKTPYFDNTKK